MSGALPVLVSAGGCGCVHRPERQPQPWIMLILNGFRFWNDPVLFI